MRTYHPYELEVEDDTEEQLVLAERCVEALADMLRLLHGAVGLDEQEEIEDLFDEWGLDL